MRLGRPPGAISQGEAVPQIPDIIYAATHKERLEGGVDGHLTLSALLIQFDTESDHYSFPIDSIARPDNDGFILQSGKKYHFRVQSFSKDQVELLFSSWNQRAQQVRAQ